MGGKRSNGEGSIYKRADGKWCSAITVGTDPITGKIKRKTFYGKTKEEVRQKLIDLQYKLQNDAYIEPSILTFSAWIDIWLNQYKKGSIRDKTFENYEYLSRVHIKPSIGNIQLKKLTPEVIQNFYNEKHEHGRSDGKGGLSAKTVRNIHNIIHECLDQAIKSGKITRNVSEATTLPRKQQKEIHILTREDEIKFLKVAIEDRLGIAFIVSLATGLRLGELLGLHWADINLDEGIINVRQALARVKLFKEDGSTESVLKFQPPKTKAGRRTIPLPTNVLKYIKVHKLNQSKEKLSIGEDYENNALVFCTEFGKPIDPRNLIRKFQQILKKANLSKTNLHSLRHTYATRLLESNEHPKVVQEILGHSSISVTLDIYSHVLPEIKKAAAEKINDIFEIKNPSVKEGLIEK
ncbi:Tyrosine recombinase XerC [bioreactor metagenome]|uniref:Tyrosine recombinase XerC n=1 Tax=bioreactor metagenome TaxID=1076179 RepID=A0A645BBN4_9ZZZZ